METKVTDNVVENFCKQFVEKIFSRLYNTYWILDVAVHCLCYFDLKKKAQFIYFSKHIKSCFETIIEFFCPKSDNQTGTKVSQLRKTYRWWFRQCLQIFCGKGCGSRTSIVCVEYPEVVLEFIRHDCLWYVIVYVILLCTHFS